MKEPVKYGLFFYWSTNEMDLITCGTSAISKLSKPDFAVLLPLIVRLPFSIL